VGGTPCTILLNQNCQINPRSTVFEITKVVHKESFSVSHCVIVFQPSKWFGTPKMGILPPPKMTWVSCEAQKRIDSLSHQVSIGPIIANTFCMPSESESRSCRSFAGFNSRPSFMIHQSFSGSSGSCGFLIVGIPNP
jgi:hypothetical protein